MSPNPETPPQEQEKPRRFRRRSRRRRFRFKFDLHRAMFVLPNLFTLSSVLCGLYAILTCLHSTYDTDLSKACLAIFFGAFFDMADGRVARLTKTQSEFGVQLDSLADAVTFGVAPAVLAYSWGLRDLGLPGGLFCFAFLACGLIRLARFNVLAANSTEQDPYFLGVPIPLAAGTIISLIWTFIQFDFLREKTHTVVSAFMLFLAVLMVSNVRYRNFKKLKANGQTIGIIIASLAAFLLIAICIQASVAIFVSFSAYLILGLIENAIRKNKDLRSQRQELETDEP